MRFTLDICESISVFSKQSIPFQDYITSPIIQVNFFCQLVKYYGWDPSGKLKIPSIPSNFSTMKKDGVLMLNAVFPEYYGMSSEERTLRTLWRVVQDSYGSKETLPDWLKFDPVNFKRVDDGPILSWGIIDLKTNLNMPVNNYLKISDVNNFAGSQLLMAIIMLRYLTYHIMSRDNLQFVMAGCRITDDGHKFYDSPCLHFCNQESKIELVSFVNSNFKGNVSFPEYRPLQC